MNNRPIKITIINRGKQKRLNVRVINKTKEKSFKSLSTKCRLWVIKNGFPISFKVSYGFDVTPKGKREEFTNEMVCEEIIDVSYALQTFVKEYMDE